MWSFGFVLCLEQSCHVTKATEATLFNPSRVGGETLAPRLLDHVSLRGWVVKPSAQDFWQEVILRGWVVKPSLHLLCCPCLSFDPEVLEVSLSRAVSPDSQTTRLCILTMQYVRVLQVIQAARLFRVFFCVSTGAQNWTLWRPLLCSTIELFLVFRIQLGNLTCENMFLNSFGEPLTHRFAFCCFT